MEREYNTSFEPIATPETLRHRLEDEEEKKQRNKRGEKTIKLEDCTVKTLEYLQTNGKGTLQEISQGLDIPYRRVSDVLQVLQTTPLISRGHKVDHFRFGQPNKNPYVFCDGTKLKEPVNVATILTDIEDEQQKIEALKRKIEDNSITADDMSTEDDSNLL